MNLVGRKFENSRLGMDIYVYEIEGKEWFVGKDIAVLLGYSENSKPLRKWGTNGAVVWEENKKKIYVKTVEIIEKCSTSTSIINNNITFVNESGLYQLIFGSTLTKAQEFQKWVFEEVLPSLRKNSFYIDEKNLSKENFDELKSQFEKLKLTMFDICEMGKISLGKASELLLGDKHELKHRFVKLGWLDYDKCQVVQRTFKASNGNVYELFVYNVSGTYDKGKVNQQLQVSLTNAGYIWLKDKIENDKDWGK